MNALQKKYNITGNTTIPKWVKKYGHSGLGSVDISVQSDVHIAERLEAIGLRNELEAARIKIAALEALVEESSKLMRIDLKKKFGGKS